MTVDLEVLLDKGCCAKVPDSAGVALPESVETKNIGSAFIKSSCVSRDDRAVDCLKSFEKCTLSARCANSSGTKLSAANADSACTVDIKQKLRTRI